jgi:hypothetical protein
MKLFAVRWPGGSFSVALADNRLAAIDEFDKLGETNGLEIKEFEEFLATFKLSEEGEIELEALDSDTSGEPVQNWAFPLWAEALEESELTEAARREIARNVEIAPKVPIDPEVRRLSKEFDMHPDLVERTIRSVRRRPPKK